LIKKRQKAVEERVQKLMAQANIGSRRACEDLIRQRRVRVNGVIVDLGAKADPDKDVIYVDDQRLKFDKSPKVFIAVNKPKQVLSTTEPHEGDNRQTVRDLVPLQGHLFSIGRLDADSEGLMILTNDGEMANRLSHPRYRHSKTYKVIVEGLPVQATLDKWREGVYLPEDGITAPCTVEIVKGAKEQTILRVIMTEGKKRQIRRVAAQLGHPVIKLTRTHIGQLGIGELRPGEWRELEPHEVALLTKTTRNRYPMQKRSARPARSERDAAGQTARRPTPKPRSASNNPKTNSRGNSKRGNRKRSS
jgi:23S rRNA pseudouridine2605 synthase